MQRFHFSWVALLIIISTVLAACASTVSVNPTPSPAPTATPLPIPTDAPLQELFPGEFSECILSEAVQKESFSAPTPLTPDHVLGELDQPQIILTVYNDMQCPYCAAFHPVLLQLLAEYPDQLQVVFRHLPLFMVHDKAFIAAQALEAVALQDEQNYFRLQDHLLSTQEEWSTLTPEAFSAYLRELLPELGVDLAQFDLDMMNQTTNQALLQELNDNIAAGIASTPYLLLNGEPYTALSRDLATLRTVIELELLTNRQFDSCPPRLIEEGGSYTATLHTTQGEIVLALFADQAPLAVNNFIFLSQQGWYDDNPFYSVIPGQYALTGDPTGSSLGTPGYTFRTEVNSALTFDRAGVIAMNNAGSPNSNGSQFFITFEPLPELDGKFTIFGQVIEGLEVLAALAPRNPAEDAANQYFDMILSVTINEQ